MSMPTLAELVAQSGAGAPAYFDKNSAIGDVLTGEVLDVNVRQALDVATRKPLEWPDGTPRLQVVITLQTDIRDEKDDDGHRSVYVKWWTHQRAAFLAACEAAELSEVLPGDKLTVTFSGTEKNPQKGMSDAKLFTYEIARPF